MIPCTEVLDLHQKQQKLSVISYTVIMTMNFCILADNTEKDGAKRRSSRYFRHYLRPCGL